MVEEKLKKDSSFKYKPQKAQASSSGIFATQNSSETIAGLENRIAQLEAELSAKKEEEKPKNDGRCTIL